MRKRFRKGVGLIDLMASLLIIGFVSVGTVTIFFSGEKMVSGLERKLEAYNFCQETMERLVGQGYFSLNPISSAPDPLPPDSILKNYFQGNRIYKIALIQPEVKEISVIVSWNEGGRLELASLTTLITDHE